MLDHTRLQSGEEPGVPRSIDGKQYYSTQEVADHAGVSKATLLRWIKSGDVKEPKRDRRDWRIFTEREMHGVYEWANRTTS